ncbi:hypothetical protein [Streptomyces sp. XH2]|uniref:hypothetical protein n=1 Tax=Streptomyces sp. XH2 TaxID=3412483 RepID=UPI003C7AB95B
MSERKSQARTPRTTWEYAVSAADQMVLWHADASPGMSGEPLRTQAVVLLAASISQWAATAGREGPEIIGAPLEALSQSLRECPVSALRECPAVESCGAAERAHLLDAHGGPVFAAVQHATLDVLRHHLRDSSTTGSAVTIADRRAALQAAAAARSRYQDPDEGDF